MREHPAARNCYEPGRFQRQELILPENRAKEKEQAANYRSRMQQADGKLGELPEFLVYVQKVKKYELV